MLKAGGVQVMDEGLLRSYEALLTPEEHAHMIEGSTPAIRKERLLARVLVRTTLSRYAHCASVCELPVRNTRLVQPTRKLALPLSSLAQRHRTCFVMRRMHGARPLPDTAL